MSVFNNQNPFNGQGPNFGSGMPNFNVDPEKAKARKEAMEKSMKNAGRSFKLIFVILIAVVTFSNAFYIVDEREHAIVFRFSEIVAVNVNNLTTEEIAVLESNPEYQNIKLTIGAGMKFKVPFVDSVEKFSNQLITYDTLPREVITSDKKKLILDNNAQWWIVDPMKFKITMKTINSANQRIEDVMYSKMNEKVGLTAAHDLISNKSYVANMLHENTNELNTALSGYGIKIADIQIKRTDFPMENNENIFNRMRTEREQMARQYRSEGREESEKIKSTAEKDAAKLRAEANAEAQRIRGKGDADAAAIFNEAYNGDPEFYRFYKTLETYRSTLPNSGARIIISPDSEFAKYLFSAK